MRLDILEAWEAGVDACVAELEHKLVEIRRYIHAHPEPSGEEVETSKFIAARLADAGISARVCKKGVGVVADLAVGSPLPKSPLIAIRSDIDALRMPDEKTVHYKSLNAGVAHACGHDAHATIVLGAALAGSRLLPPMGGESADLGLRLRFLFQSAEETSEGAIWLVEEGALEGVDAILGLHVDPERKAGEVGIRYGTLTANCDEVEIRVDGHGGHAARPHHSIDPVAAASQLITALYQSLPRSVDSRNPSVFTVGQISGGYAPNVIPESVLLRGTLRTTDADSRNTLKRRFGEIVHGVEEVTRAKISYRFFSPLNAVHNHPQVTAALEEASHRVVGRQNVAIIDRPSMGGEDFSVYLEHVPGAMLRLGCALPGESSPFLHSPLFDLDERAIAIGTRILLRAAMLLCRGNSE